MDEYDESDLEDELDELKQENKELKEEIEKLRNFNASLIRQIKERANASKGQFPKKQHTGYSLTSSTVKEVRYYDGGNKSVYLFETVFQTPYLLDIVYNDVLELITNDLIDEDDDKTSIINTLGFPYLIDCKSYKDLYKNDDYKDLYQDYEEEYKRKTKKNYLYSDDYSIIRKALEKDINSSCFNLNVRMNGKAGYWEMSINHIEPLEYIPPELRFPIKTKKSKTKKET